MDDTSRKLSAGLLPHEYVHSWNGKYRRPYDLATPDYQQPMQDDLLWVYEGLTNYLGFVLTARSGLLTTEQIATISRSPPRNWIIFLGGNGAICRTPPMPRRTLFRPAVVVLLAARHGFLQRRHLELVMGGRDYPPASKGKKSIEDFCQLFHGAPSTARAEDLYLR